MRAARTDKGVSAVGNVVSFKMICTSRENPEEDMVQRINARLPRSLTVYGFVRTTGSFDARKLCDKRLYEYVLPVYAFHPGIFERPRKSDAPENQFPQEMIDKLNAALKHYEGTHNFVNFTVRMEPNDPGAKRYIIFFRFRDVVDIDGVKHVRMEVLGQSFMLHQIRKMVGMAVALMRGVAPDDAIKLALDAGKSETLSTNYCCRHSNV